MADLTLLRARVYERDKHDAGWGAANTVSVAYVLGHTCAVDTRDAPYGRKRTDARWSWHGDGYGNSDGDGFGNGTGAGGGYGCGYGDGYGHCNGSGFGNGNGDGQGEGDGEKGRPWKV